MEANLESMENLESNLKEMGIELANVPFVIQYNKRDLPDVDPVDELRAQLNTRGVPDFECSAKNGPGVFETLKGLSKLVLTQLRKK